MRVRFAWPAAALALAAGPAAADDEDTAPLPEVEFLEYLGSWQDEDEPWWLDSALESDDIAAAPERPDAGRAAPDPQKDDEP